MALRHRRSTAAFVAAVALLAPAGCSSPGTSDPAATTADPDQRIDTIRQLRSTVGPRSAELGTAAATLVQQLDEFHAAPPRDPTVRRETVATIRSGSLALLERTLDGYGPDLVGDETGPDAEDVSAAMGEVRGAAVALARAAVEDLQRVEEAAEAEERLAAAVEAWSEPGSRNEQLQRLEEVAGEVDALATELEAVEDVPACSGLVARRAEAARAVAAHTRELRALVEQRRGDEFDARRDELLQDPYGTGGLLVEEDRREIGCWREAGPVVAAADEFAAALDRLEEALNPPDLASPSAG